MVDRPPTSPQRRHPVITPLEPAVADPRDPHSKSSPPFMGKVGSLSVFWPLIEPILARLAPRRVCEVGVESGAFTVQLVAWARRNACAYVGVDPAVDPALSAEFESLTPVTDGSVASATLVAGRSLDVLPDLERCGAYFLDGDHNYHTVRHELDCVQRATSGKTGDPAGPLVFAHDVGWPWGRRDMYYRPVAVPAEARHPSSDHLGVPLEGDDLIDGGLRAPGVYDIALRSGGERNGVLTAVEDFLKSEAGAAWESFLIPAAYGLAVLYRPGDAALPAPCLEHLRELRRASSLTGGFLEACEANYQTLYFYGEHARYERDELAARVRAEQSGHHGTLEAYADLERVHHALVAHCDAVGGEYHRLRTEYSALLAEYHRLLEHCARLQEGCDKLIATSRALPPAGGGPNFAAGSTNPTRCELQGENPSIDA